MTGRDLRKAETRRLVLEAARSLFLERGVEATTARLVAERAGVAVGTVFLHFPDMRALLEWTLHDQVEAALTAAFATLPGRGLVADLAHVAGRLFDGYAAAPALSRALVRGALFDDPPPAGAGVDARPLRPQLARFSAWLEGRFRQAAQRGELAPGVDPALAGFAFFGLYFAVLVAGLRGDLPHPALRPTLERLLAQHLPCTPIDEEEPHDHADERPKPARPGGGSGDRRARRRPGAPRRRR
jgi:AcrR family transcriptional regulator